MKRAIQKTKVLWVTFLLVVFLASIAQAMPRPKLGFEQVYENNTFAVFLDLESVEYCIEGSRLYPTTFAILGHFWVYAKSNEARDELAEIYSFGNLKANDWTKITFMAIENKGEPLILHIGKIESRYKPTLEHVFTYDETSRKYILTDTSDYHFKWSREALDLVYKEIFRGRHYEQFRLR